MSGGASTSHMSCSTSEVERSATLGLISLGQGSHSRAVISTSQTQQGDDRAVAKDTVLFGNSIEHPSPPGASFEQTSDHLYTAPAIRMPDFMDRHRGGEKLTAAMSVGASTSHTSHSTLEAERKAALGLLSLRLGPCSRVFIPTETKPQPGGYKMELYCIITNCRCYLKPDGDWDCPCTRYLEFVNDRGYERKLPVRFSG
ncbi:hypothetical protein BsWGS_10861 [Bradybaena similaris]